MTGLKTQKTHDGVYKKGFNQGWTQLVHLLKNHTRIRNGPNGPKLFVEFSNDLPLEF